MTPDGQLIFNVIFGVAMAALGWVMNSLRDSIASLHASDTALAAKVQSIEVLVAGTYVKRDDMDKLLAAVFLKLDRIESKLDSKADKSTCQAIHKGDLL